MTYADAVAYLDSFVNYERLRDVPAMRAVTLQRMRQLCRRLGDPHRRFRSILVTGTNGKGSISALLYSMLRESHLRAGLYTSPHVEHLRERIRVTPDGPTRPERVHTDDWISEAEFAALVERIRPIVEQMRSVWSTQPPTYFELMTALAFVHFAQRDVDIAVLEVGLGGRLDATNIVDQAVSVFGPIDVDHADVLGYEPATIAAEKAAIIRAPHQVMSVLQSAPVDQVLRQACEAQGASLMVCGQDLTTRVHEHGFDGLRVSITGLRGIYQDLSLPLIGRHQAQNAAVAIAALEALSTTGIPATLVERGLARVEWPGRIEVVSEHPLVLMDGAHNPHAAAALATTLMELCGDRPIHLLIGVSADKAIEEVGKQLGPLAVSATCTKSRHHPRALDPVELAKRLAPYCPDVHVMTDPVDAYTYLLNAVGSEEVIVVTGSLFLVGELRAAIRRSHVRSRRAASLELAAASS